MATRAVRREERLHGLREPACQIGVRRRGRVHRRGDAAKDEKRNQKKTRQHGAENLRVFYVGRDSSGERFVALPPKANQTWLQPHPPLRLKARSNVVRTFR